MTTLAETIARELLDAVDTPDELKAVLQQHSHSKGPLYIALARATASLRDRLRTLNGESQQAEEECREHRKEADAAQQELAGLKGEVKAKEKELTSIEGKVKDKRMLLDQAQALAGLGFGQEQLRQLHELLTRIAASHGASPKDAVTLFFREVDGYGNILSIELEAERAGVVADKAKAEAERWQAQTQAAEARCKARKASIDVVEKMLGQDVKEADLPQWTRIVAQAGVTPEKLAQALDQYASLEKLGVDRQQRVEKLTAQARELETQVKALKEERQQLAAGIDAVKEEALAAVGRASNEVLAHIEALANKGKEYGELERHAARLEQELTLARAFTSQDTKQWKEVPRRAVQELLRGLVIWAEADFSHNPTVDIPHFVPSRYYLYSVGELRLEDLLMWALSGVSSDEERIGLASGR